MLKTILFIYFRMFSLLIVNISLLTLYDQSDVFLSTGRGVSRGVTDVRAAIFYLYVINHHHPVMV